jgi:DNA polymerase-3 subunit alpha
MAAALSADMEHTDKIVTLIWACRELQLEVLPPDVNSCHYGFEAVGEKQVRYGLGAIKGLGQSVIDLVVGARGDRPFRDLFDFCERLGGGRVNRRALEALIKSGALDRLGADRASLMAQLPDAISAAERKSQDRLSGQAGLFEAAETPADRPNAPAIAPWTRARTLAAEKETLGLYLSGHPVDDCRADLDQVVDAALADFQVVEETPAVVAGLAVAMRVQVTRKGNRMAYLTLDDGTGRTEILVFPETYQKHRDLLHKDTVLIVQGLASVDEFTGGFKVAAERIFDLERLRAGFAHTLVLELSRERLNADMLAGLEELLARHAAGSCALRFRYRNEAAHAWLAAGVEWTVKPDAALIEELTRRFGEGHVLFFYRAIEPMSKPRFRGPPAKSAGADPDHAAASGSGRAQGFG